MQSDEQAIRALVCDWQNAAASGDIDKLVHLMADDVVFMTPGQPPMRGKQSFMEAFEEGLKHYRIESHGEIQELHIVHDFAYCWTHMTVTVTPHSQGLPMRRSGNTLSILQKQPDAGWVIVRDANMLTPEPAFIPS